MTQRTGDADVTPAPLETLFRDVGSRPEPAAQGPAGSTLVTSYQ